MLDRRMTGMQPKKKLEGIWEYLLLVDDMSESGLEEVETYVFHFQNTIYQYIVTCLILGLCLS